MTVPEMASLVATVTGGLVGFWRISRYFAKSESSAESLSGQISALDKKFDEIEERTDQRIGALAADIKPLAASIADLRTRMEDIRVENAQSAAKFEAQRAREETIRLELKMLAEDVKDMGLRMERIEDRMGDKEN